MKNNYFELRDQLNIHPEILNYLDKRIPEVLSKFKEPKKDDAPGRFRNQHALYICVNGSKIPYIGKHSSDDLSTDEYKGSSSILSDEEKTFFTRYDLILTNTAKGAYWLEGQILNQDFINEFGYYTTGLIYNATKGGEYRNGLTQEQALSNLFEAHGGDIVLVGNYTGSHDKHTFRCKEGHIWEGLWSSVVSSGKSCPKCNLIQQSKACVIKFPNGKIETYASLIEAERQTGLHNGGIKKCCDGEMNHTKGHQCMYLEDYEKGKKFSDKKFKPYKKLGPIINIETNKYFNSPYEAEKQAKNLNWVVRESTIYRNILGKVKSAGKDKNGNKLTWRKATKKEIKSNPDMRTKGTPIIAIGKDILFFNHSHHAKEKEFNLGNVSTACRGIYNCKDPHYYKGYLWYYQDEVLIVDKE